MQSRKAPTPQETTAWGRSVKDEAVCAQRRLGGIYRQGGLSTWHRCPLRIPGTKPTGRASIVISVLLLERSFVDCPASLQLECYTQLAIRTPGTFPLLALLSLLETGRGRCLAARRNTSVPFGSGGSKGEGVDFVELNSYH